MENRKNIVEVTSQRLGQLDKTPHDRVWERIRSDLEKKRRRRFLFWILFALGLFLLLALLFASFTNNLAAVEWMPESTIIDSKGSDQKTPASSVNTDSIDKINQNNTIQEASKPINKSVVSFSKSLTNANNKQSSAHREMLLTIADTTYARYGAITNYEYANPSAEEKLKDLNSMTMDIISEPSTADSLSFENAKSSKLPKETKPVSIEQNKFKADWGVALYGSVNSYMGGFKKSQLDNRLDGVKGTNTIKFDPVAYLVYGGDNTAFIRLGAGRVTLNREIPLPQNIDAANLQYVKYRNNLDVSSLTGTQLVEVEARYFNIPLDLGYRLIRGKVDLAIMGNVSYMVLLEDRVSAISNTDRTDLGRSSIYYDNIFAIGAGVQFRYHLARRINVNLEPMIKKQLRVYRISAIDSPFTFNAQLGLEYSF
ncbi:porin family protein [Nonlabens marinus]|uniref:Outer membrane protein beta-barrel domain-containing protein n=1 Tax=Nonlabens marinus S1-08 TaxID=1454201 RepID=W8VSZ8_9FLAO|nr:hypothetical protein [Nonlabens marinus]BAO56650.1 hypothetical protein NMS_2641 [Nonlabens marinus S1-08]